MSIQPKWCELIASGKKTVEVRKTKPKLEAPFKVYIYETRAKCDRPIMLDFGVLDFHGRGQVIGEFVSDDIFALWSGYSGNNGDDCLTFDGRERYLGFNSDGSNRMGYGWHISDLVIYDKPKELSEFKVKRTITTYTTEHNIEGIVHYPKKEFIFDDITTPPQSWCYCYLEEWE